MTMMTLSLTQKIQKIVSNEFKIERSNRTDMLTFRSKKIPNNPFYLFYEVLTEYEILEVAKILVEVYGNIREVVPRSKFSDSDEPVELNCPEDFSGEFVGEVLDLKASALHKLLLLTSGEWFMSNKGCEDVLTLARAKKEIPLEPNEIATNRRLYTLLKQFYILPGVAPRTFASNADSVETNQGRNSIETFSRLMAFIVNKFEDVTLGEHLALSFSEGVSTKKTLTGFSQPNKIQNVLLSCNKDLARSMPASEAISLSFILDKEMSEGDFPENILSNRSKAMESDVAPISRYEMDSILRYLSKEEQKALSSATFVEHLNELIENRDIGSKTPPIVYAALAEVLSVKGEKKALEVAKSLTHIRNIQDGNLKIFEATVAIIELALNTETEDFPFSWIAQLNENAWVFNSHLQENEIFEVSL